MWRGVNSTSCAVATSAVTQKRRSYITIGLPINSPSRVNFIDDTSFECCSFTKIFLHLYSDWVDLYSIRYIIESVFALSLCENVEVFKCKRTTDNTHSLYSYAAMHLLVYLPSYYPSVGYRIVYSYIGLSTTFT